MTFSNISTDVWLQLVAALLVVYQINHSALANRSIRRQQAYSEFFSIVQGGIVGNPHAGSNPKLIETLNLVLPKIYLNSSPGLLATFVKDMKDGKILDHKLMQHWIYLARKDCDAKWWELALPLVSWFVHLFQESKISSSDTLWVKADNK